MNILYEESIPEAQAYFSSLGYAVAFSTGQHQTAALSDAEVLLVRSTTQVNAALLDAAPHLRWVGTATAGSDHLDKQALSERGIEWVSAAGCNAVAVAEYVVSVLLCAHLERGLDLTQARIGIVGAGQVGSALSRHLDALGVQYLLYDPPLQEQSDPRKWASWADILACDVITLHVPLVEEGDHPTRRLIDDEVLSQLRAPQLLINACRGEVVDQHALMRRLSQPNAPSVVLDVFDNEPFIDAQLLPLLWLATPHIAGHTIEGKLRGTQQLYNSLCAWRNQPATKQLEQFLPLIDPIALPSMSCLDELSTLLLSIYDIRLDDRQLRLHMAQSASFAPLRKHYRVRRELSAHRLTLANGASPEWMKTLSRLGFRLS